RLYHGGGDGTRGRTYYTLADEPRPTIRIACSKCPWKAEFSRADLISNYGAEYPMPNLLDHLAMPGCSKIRSHWNRCGLLRQSNRKRRTVTYPSSDRAAASCL